jgi:hypothetical protein
MADCPFCKSCVHEDATVCPFCKAQKGYTQAQGIVYGKFGTVLCGIIIPSLLMIGCLFIPSYFALVACIFLIPIVLSVWRLKTGPVWYRFNRLN